MSTERGMNSEPMQSYSIADRLICAKCRRQPSIVKAEGTGPVLITVSCHGSQETKSIEKNELVFDQVFFENDAEV
jgi:hypothetical protein